MDYNNIKSRIQRTYRSLNARYDDDIWQHAHYHFYQRGNEQRVSITFGTEDETEIIGTILTILYNLASFKDNLKNSMKEKGLDFRIVEREIDKSFHLQVLMDIVNQDKHGAPLNRYRSKKKPIIKDATQSLRMGSKNRDIEGNVISKDGPSKMLIDAKIRDEDNNILFYLDDLVEVCYSKWIAIIKEQNLAELTEKGR